MPAPLRVPVSIPRAASICAMAVSESTSTFARSTFTPSAVTENSAPSAVSADIAWSIAVLAASPSTSAVRLSMEIFSSSPAWIIYGLSMPFSSAIVCQSIPRALPISHKQSPAFTLMVAPSAVTSSVSARSPSFSFKLETHASLSMSTPSTSAFRSPSSTGSSVTEAVARFQAAENSSPSCPLASIWLTASIRALSPESAMLLAYTSQAALVSPEAAPMDIVSLNLSMICFGTSWPTFTYSSTRLRMESASGFMASHTFSSAFWSPLCKNFQPPPCCA